MPKEAYISQTPERQGTVTKIDIVSNADPFARESIQRLTTLETAIEDARMHEDSLASLRNAHIHYVGPTASIRDLKFVTDADADQIQILSLLVHTQGPFSRILDFCLSGSAYQRHFGVPDRQRFLPQLF